MQALFLSYSVFVPLGPVFGSKDNFHGLAIFLDTYPNDESTEVSSSKNMPWELFLLVSQVSILALASRNIQVECTHKHLYVGFCNIYGKSHIYTLKLLNCIFFLTQRVFPYISAMVNNGSLSYDHSKDGRWTELAGCTADLRNQNHDTFLAVRYSKGRLTVS